MTLSSLKNKVWIGSFCRPIDKQKHPSNDSYVIIEMQFVKWLKIELTTKSCNYQRALARRTSSGLIHIIFSTYDDVPRELDRRKGIKIYPIAIFHSTTKWTSTEALLGLLCDIVLLTVYYWSGAEQGGGNGRGGRRGKGSMFLMGGRRIK